MDRVKKIVNLENSIEILPKEKGQSVGVAILDTGVAPHPDLTHNVSGFKDFVGDYPYPYDDNGHGTHIAGILCGSGEVSAGKYRGIGPEIDLFMLKVLDKEGVGEVKDMIKAMDWVLMYHKKYNIHVVNLSVGGSKTMSKTETYLLLDKIKELWDNGLNIVTSAGNNGPTFGSITIPGISGYAITVGAGDDYLYKSKHAQMRVNYSGRGPTKEGLVKPNLLAPGTYIKSCNYKYGYNRKEEAYVTKSGTSMATPMVSAAIAKGILINPFLDNIKVKELLEKSCRKENRPVNEQGFGYLNIAEFIKLCKVNVV